MSEQDLRNELRASFKNRAVLYLEACPLKEAWEEPGLDDHDKAVMCEIAGEIDKGTFEAAGFNFQRDTWQPGRTGCCHLKIRAQS